MVEEGILDDIKKKKKEEANLHCQDFCWFFCWFLTKIYFQRVGRRLVSLMSINYSLLLDHSTGQRESEGREREREREM